MKKVLITGMAGFIGSSLARACVERGWDVSGIDNLSTGNLSNLKGVPQAKLTEGEIQDRERMAALCQGVDTIFHEAALPSVAKSVLNPAASHAANIEGTFSVLLAAKEAGVRRVVYAASSSAYGESETLPKHEGMVPAPISPYAVQKLTGEYYMQSFARVYELETVCLRYFNVFGPHQAADSPYSGVLAKFITMMLAGETPQIHGDGTQSRDFTYIANVVDANLLAASAPAGTVSGKVYNIACGEQHSLLKMYDLLASAIGFSGRPAFGPSRTGDIRHSLADIQRAAADLKYKPRVPLLDGLYHTIEWYRREAEAAGQKVLTPATA